MAFWQSDGSETGPQSIGKSVASEGATATVGVGVVAQPDEDMTARTAAANATNGLIATSVRRR
jgi:hypothetical protein